MIMFMLEKMYSQKKLNEESERDYIDLLNDIELFSIKSQIFHYFKSSLQVDPLTTFLISNTKNSYERASYQNFIAEQ